MESGFLVYIKALENDVGKHWNPGITHHTVGFIAYKMPYWKFSLLLEDM